MTHDIEYDIFTWRKMSFECYLTLRYALNTLLYFTLPYTNWQLVNWASTRISGSQLSIINYHDRLGPIVTLSPMYE